MDTHNKHTDRMSPSRLALQEITQIIDQVTGIRWQPTSYIRNSPSHSNGYSLDVAPDHHARRSIDYAGDRLSDPILARRLDLLKMLDKAPRLIHKRFPNIDVGIFLETDHIHIQIAPPPRHRGGRTGFFQWSEPKAAYQDSSFRHSLKQI